ncbi:alpha/beta fold hydrolase [Streptomyces sp. NL15-2K]|uniref:alpha/beta fold hydrolase n=1 Tax=Streptomyces sp. NL15-2K TaxID=376149 RepID=UPI000F56D7BA|nr:MULTISPECIES: alpha/beta fold hydrolase [Actinomycetes]WKX06958.1 alpha/beta fold hydrolase [Kutzneria buriramensis]
MTTTQLPSRAPQITDRRRAARSVRLLGRALLVLLGVLLAPVAAIAAVWATASVTAELALLAAAGVAALVVGCALPVYAGLRRRTATALVTAAVLLLTSATAFLTVLQPLDEQPPHPRSRPTGYWSLPTGSRLAYTLQHAQGRPRETPVIVLHGGPGTPGDGPDPLERLLTGQGYDVYSYDQLGSGRSGRLADPSGYTVARQVADLEAVRARIGARRVVLLGASWGATLAAEYLAAHPGRVARMVLTSPGVLWAPAWKDRSEGDIWDRLTPEQQQEIDALEDHPRLAAWSLLMAANPRAAHALVPDSELDPIFAELLDIAAPAATCHPDRPLRDLPASVPGFYANQLTGEDQLTVPDPRPALRRTRVPVLVLRGACDYKNPGIAREYDEVLPNATLVTVAGAGHLIDMEQPEVYRRTVTRFLDR